MPGRQQRRIALVTHGFELGGGVPTVARWLADNLKKIGSYQIDVIDLATSRRDPYSRKALRPQSWTRRSLSHHAGPNGPIHWGANAVELEFMRYRPRRGLTAALNQYDLVQVVCGSPAWGNAVINVQVPVVIQAATIVDWERQRAIRCSGYIGRAWTQAMTAMTKPAEKAAIRRADAVLVENVLIAGHLKALGARNLHVAPPGVDVDTFRPRTTEFEGTPYLLSVCRLADPRKGLPRMIDAYTEFHRRRPECPRLILAGGGNLDAPAAEALRKSAARDKITVLRDVPQEELVHLYQGAQAFIQTSFEEGLGLSVLEAMASGLPVLATRTAGSNETVTQGVTGWLIDSEDHDFFEDQFIKRLNSLIDVDADSFGRAGRRRAVEHFSTGATLQRFEDVYSKLLHR